MHIGAHPHLLPNVLNLMLEILVLEECSNQWSLSRPLLGLILLNQDVTPPPMTSC
jgi:exportin-7